MQLLPLNDGNTIPQLGLGVWQLNDEDTYASVRAGIAAGYRHIDTAAIYGNEEPVGRAVADAIEAGEVSREDLFITTKLWNKDQTSGEAAFEASLQRLGMDYVDLYLLHWPCPEAGTFVQAYESMAKVQASGAAKSIGVCNFYPEALDALKEAGFVPAVNQIEVHPGLSQAEQRADNERRGIVTEAWSPLGQGQNLQLPLITSLAQEHGVTPAQVIIRWHLQRGDVVIPRSSKPERVRENFDVFGFELSAEEIASIEQLDRADGRIGPDPREFHADTPAAS